MRTLGRELHARTTTTTTTTVIAASVPSSSLSSDRKCDLEDGTTESQSCDDAAAAAAAAQILQKFLLRATHQQQLRTARVALLRLHSHAHTKRFKQWKREYRASFKINTFLVRQIRRVSSSRMSKSILLLARRLSDSRRQSKQDANDVASFLKSQKQKDESMAVTLAEAEMATRTATLRLEEMEKREMRGKKQRRSERDAWQKKEKVLTLRITAVEKELQSQQTKVKNAAVALREVEMDCSKGKSREEVLSQRLVGAEREMKKERKAAAGAAAVAAAGAAAAAAAAAKKKMEMENRMQSQRSAAKEQDMLARVATVESTLKSERSAQQKKERDMLDQMEAAEKKITKEKVARKKKDEKIKMLAQRNKEQEKNEARLLSRIKTAEKEHKEIQEQLRLFLLQQEEDKRTSVAVATCTTSDNLTKQEETNMYQLQVARSLMSVWFFASGLHRSLWWDRYLVSMKTESSSNLTFLLIALCGWLLCSSVVLVIRNDRGRSGAFMCLVYLVCHCFCGPMYWMKLAKTATLVGCMSYVVVVGGKKAH